MTYAVRAGGHRRIDRVMAPRFLDGRREGEVVHVVVPDEEMQLARPVLPAAVRVGPTPKRSAWRATEEIARASGRRFDPEVVEAFDILIGRMELAVAAPPALTLVP